MPTYLDVEVYAVVCFHSQWLRQFPRVLEHTKCRHHPHSSSSLLWPRRPAYDPANADCLQLKLKLKSDKLGEPLSRHADIPPLLTTCVDTESQLIALLLTGFVLVVVTSSVLKTVLHSIKSIKGVGRAILFATAPRCTYLMTLCQSSDVSKRTSSSLTCSHDS